MTDFTSLLSKRVEEAERPKPLPIGTYRFGVTRFEFGESSKKKTPFVRFWVRAVLPLDDVDTELLPDNWQTREERVDFFLTDDAMYRLREFLENLSIAIASRTFDVCIQEAPGREFAGHISHEVVGANTYTNVDKTAAI